MPRTLFALVSAVGILAAAGSVRAQVVTVDNLDAGFTALNGNWQTGSFPTPWATDYRFSDTVGGGTALVEWRPDLPEDGIYRVDVWYVEGVNRATNAGYTIHHLDGSTAVNVNQQAGGSQWNALGSFSFAAGTDGYVTLSNDANPNVVIADAVRFTFEGEITQGSDEFRAMWVSRFEWPNSNLATVQNNITSILNNLQANNFNAVLMQVRGQCDTLYPSPEEVWSNIVSSDGNAPPSYGSFDPLAYAIAQAHARGLEFHAYINTHVAWQGGSCAKPNYAPNHIFWDHFDEDNPAARDWLVHDESGIPVGCEESNYTWIAPGVPAAMAYVRRQIMYVVENYDVDGVHFDRIRTPGIEYSHDPISEARRTGQGNPDGLGFADWTRDQITRFNRDMYAQIMEVKPHVKVSSAPVGLYAGVRYAAYGYPQSDCGYFYGYSCLYQDAQAWLAAGAQDFICPQIYWADGGNNPDFSEILPDWLANAAGRHIYAGQITSVGISALLSQVDVSRSMGAGGNTVFSYSSFNNNNFWPSYSGPGGPYELPADTPAMPWKDNPTHGIIIGNVTHALSGQPLVDVSVTRNGSGYTALSGGDGLYSFLLVPPGTYTLNFAKTAVGTRQVCNVQVAAGQVVRVNTTLGGAQARGDFDFDGDLDLTDFATLVGCLAGPGVTYPPGDCCLPGDADDDLDVDLHDAALIDAGAP